VRVDSLTARVGEPYDDTVVNECLHMGSLELRGFTNGAFEARRGVAMEVEDIRGGGRTRLAVRRVP
jgi:hypothetical protein